MQTMDKIEKAQEEKQAISTTKMCNTHWITDELIIQTSTIFTLDNSKVSVSSRFTFWTKQISQSSSNSLCML